MATEEEREFSKLDRIDQQTAYWLMAHDLDEIQEWIKYIENRYVRKNLKVSGPKLYAELMSASRNAID